MRYLLFLILCFSFSYGITAPVISTVGEGCFPEICINGVCASEDTLTEPVQQPSVDEPPECKQILINDAFCKQEYGDNFSFVASEMGCFKEPNIIIKTLKEINSGFLQAGGAAIFALLVGLIPPVRKRISKLLGRNKPLPDATAEAKKDEEYYP